ncbi:MAG: class I SAM-dependent methyltransferase [Verrucomicrobiota bacterium]
MKAMLRKLAPPFVRTTYRNLKRRWQNNRNRNRTTEEVFTEIYTTNAWNPTAGKETDFNSGEGSRSESITRSYVACITRLSDELGFRGARFVDIGCGDMEVGRHLLPLAGDYVGVDIVEPLLEQLRAKYASPTVRFEKHNVIEDPLPEGDVCFVRQVFQHLANDQIVQILPKLSAYRFVFISEHLPTDREDFTPNLDKPHGGDIRLYKKSGVVVTEPPFSLPKDKTEVVLDVPGHGFEGMSDAGRIETILYRPRG